MSPLAATDWLDALEAEFASLATGMLGFPGVSTEDRGEQPPHGMEGAYLGLVSEDGAYQVGVVSTPDGCRALAGGLLGLEPGAEPMPDADVADALCEVVNIVAGGVKARVRGRGAGNVAMGLPTFFHGPAQTTDRLAAQVVRLKVGEQPAALVVLHPRTTRAAEAR